MRANQLMTDSVHWFDARDLYERAVELDPEYAPAWAGLGRARRMLAKWGLAGATLPLAQAAFARALALDPDLPIAHEQLAHIDVELGLAPEAMARLLDRAAERPPNARVMAGLVTACRYAGLIDASLAAHAKAEAIDPDIRTTVCWAHFLSGDYPAAIAADRGQPPFCALISQLLLGTLDANAVKAVQDQMPDGNLRTALRAYRYLAQGRVDSALADLRQMNRAGFSDPEGWFLTALFFARINARAEAIEWLSNSVGAGYTPYRALAEQPHFDSVRDMPEFARILEQARERVEHAKRLYDRAGGPKILGPVRS
jgi:tetratricopeptide (TPR) repeat protein